MKIAVNTRFLLSGKLEGIGWFTHEIFKQMVLNHPEVEFLFIFDRDYDKRFIFAKNVTPIIVSPPARHPILWHIWFNLAVPRILKQHKPDLFISTDGFASLTTSIPQMTVIHDLAFEHYPEHLPFKFRYYLRKYTPQFAKKVKRIITVSSFSKKDIAQTYHIPKDKISVIYNGAHEQYQPLSEAQVIEAQNKYAQGKPYFIFAGALHPRKNVERLLDAFTLFKEKNNCDIQLLLIGRFAWKSDAIKEKLHHHPFKNEIHHYDYMNVDELSNVIGGAFALTFVSLFEGFGIPILEAIRCNVPGIVANKTSMPEVAGNTALYVNPEDINDIAQKMSEIYNNNGLREELIAACAEQSKQFSWEKSAQNLFDLIKKELE